MPTRRSARPARNPARSTGGRPRAKGQQPPAQPFGVEGAVDLEKGFLSFNVVSSFEGGFSFRWHRILRPDAGWLHSELTASVVPLSEPARKRNWARAEQYILPILLARLSEAPDAARWIGKASFDGRAHDAVLHQPQRQ